MSNLIKALAAKYNADILNAKANIEVYVTNPAGIGEHPDLAAAIDTQVKMLRWLLRIFKTLLTNP